MKIFFNKSFKSLFCFLHFFSVIKVDEFTRNLWEIYEKIHAEGSSQVVTIIHFFVILCIMSSLNKARSNNN